MINLCELQIHTIGRPSDLSIGVYAQIIDKKVDIRSYNDPHRLVGVAYLSYITNYIRVVYEKHQFLCGKAEKTKIAVFFPAIYPCI